MPSCVQTWALLVGPAIHIGAVGANPLFKLMFLLVVFQLSLSSFQLIVWLGDIEMVAMSVEISYTCPSLSPLLWPTSWCTGSPHLVTKSPHCSGGVNVVNLHQLTFKKIVSSTQSSQKTSVKLALLNTRSLANKTFILNYRTFNF